MSIYLKTLGLAYEPKPIPDAERVGDLLKACGDFGRLGLLKLRLVDRPGEGAPETDVRQPSTRSESCVRRSRKRWRQLIANCPAIGGHAWTALPVQGGNPF
jgi:hypothetical protein